VKSVWSFGKTCRRVLGQFSSHVYTDEEPESFRDLSAAYLKANRLAQINPTDRNSAEAVKDIKDQIIHTYGPDA
jgi:hypothetical protein